jgi:anti-sigma regulatory factor (Ser/Thr protein kinase)
VYAVFDPAEQVLRMANAGHLPPVVIAPDGTATVLAEATDPPLGVSAGRLDLVVVPLPSGSTLVLYTDGLVERRGEDLDAGIADLHDVCSTLDVSLEEIPERLVQRRLPDGPDDDVAVLVARVARTRVQAVRELELVAPAVAAGQARDLVRAHLEELGVVERRVVDDAVLVASELVANALQHAELPAELRLISSRSELRVEVHDRSAAQPQRRRPDPHDDRGRGLTIVAALSEAWGARPTRTGKVVWSVVRLT